MKFRERVILPNDILVGTIRESKAERLGKMCSQEPYLFSKSCKRNSHPKKFLLSRCVEI